MRSHKKYYVDLYRILCTQDSCDLNEFPPTSASNAGISVLEIPGNTGIGTGFDFFSTYLLFGPFYVYECQK